MGTLASESGWGWPERSRKCHYFENGISLCGKWMFFGDAVKNQLGPSADDCVTCSRKVEAKTKKTTPATSSATGATLNEGTTEVTT